MGQSLLPGQPILLTRMNPLHRPALNQCRHCFSQLFRTRMVHGLRHAFATLALQAGMNPKVVSEALGHSSVTITLDTYSHVLPNMQDELAIAVENLLKRS